MQMTIATLLRPFDLFQKKQEFFCPCCRTSSETFLTFGVKPRPNAMCPVCRSLERHRLLWLYLEQRTMFFHQKISVLEIAPQKILQERFRSLPNLTYLSVDLSSSHAMRKMDLTRLEIPDDSYDCIFCYHVLEHIPDDRIAIKELFRVLKPGGWAVVQSPIDRARETTYEDTSITSPLEREKHFKQRDHVRVYGRDYVSRLAEAGFLVEECEFVCELDPETVRRCSLSSNEILHICRKPAI